MKKPRVAAPKELSWYEKKRRAGELICTLLRLTPEVHAALKERAKKEDRTLHAHVIHIVKEHLSLG